MSYAMVFTRMISTGLSAMAMIAVKCRYCDSECTSRGMRLVVSFATVIEAMKAVSKSLIVMKVTRKIPSKRLSKWR
jgi:hypothetical protein